MAPITVAIESLTTPADAITAASSNKSQKRLRRRLRSGPSSPAACGKFGVLTRPTDTLAASSWRPLAGPGSRRAAILT